MRLGFENKNFSKKTTEKANIDKYFSVFSSNRVIMPVLIVSTENFS